MKRRPSTPSPVSPLPGLASLPDRIACILRREIRSRHAPGDRLPATRALAKRFDVSVNTVQQALALLNREGLVEAWMGSGTFVAERLGKAQVGVLVESDVFHPGGSFYFQRSLIHHLRRLFSEEGFQVEVYVGRAAPGENPEELTCPRFLEDVAAGRLSGVATIGTFPHRSWMSWLEKTGVPVVGDGAPYAHHVAASPLAIAEMGMRHLIENRRLGIALMGWFAPDLHRSQDQFESLLRIELERQGAPFRREWMAGEFHPCDSGSGWAEFREIWMSRREKPDGLIICDDALLPDAAVAMAELGISVPDQLMVVTHTNKGAFRRWPFPVARIEYDPLSHAEATAGMLIRLMNQEPVAIPQLRIASTLIEAEVHDAQDSVITP